MKEASEAKNRRPVKQGLYKIAEPGNEDPVLIASRCLSCGEIFFPKRVICQNCQGDRLKEIMLSRRGKVFSYTIVMQQPASHYKGPIDVELVIEKLHDNDEGDEVFCHKFRPIASQI